MVLFARMRLTTDFLHSWQVVGFARTPFLFLTLNHRTIMATALDLMDGVSKFVISLPR